MALAATNAGGEALALPEWLVHAGGHPLPLARPLSASPALAGALTLARARAHTLAESLALGFHSLTESLEGGFPLFGWHLEEAFADDLTAVEWRGAKLAAGAALGSIGLPALKLTAPLARRSTTLLALRPGLLESLPEVQQGLRALLGGERAEAF